MPETKSRNQAGEDEQMSVSPPPLCGLTHSFGFVQTRNGQSLHILNPG